jgi:hypothetical protein
MFVVQTNYSPNDPLFYAHHGMDLADSDSSYAHGCIFSSRWLRFKPSPDELSYVVLYP